MRVTALILLALAAPAVQAQNAAPAPACSYDRCGLRVQTHLFSTRLVEGRAAIPIARIGVFPPHLRQFESSDSARAHYRAFRTEHATGTLLGLGSAGVFVAGLVLVGGNNHSNLGTVLTISGVTLGLTSGLALRHANNHLQASIWWYNRPLR